MKHVEFKTFDGCTLRGDLYLPEKHQNPPLVILAHGLTLLKEQFLDNFARSFQDSGIAALVYDHRGYGSSDGYPRSETNIWQQVEDCHDAVSFAKTELRSHIDAEKIVLWGIGHSGGMAMVASALDPRINAAIIVMPFTSGTRDSQFFPMEKVWENRTANNGPRYIQIWPDSFEQAKAKEAATLLTSTDAWDFISGAREKTREVRGREMPNELSLQSFYHISRIDPMSYIHLISPRPLLYIAAEVDNLTGPISMHKEVFDMARQPKQFVELKDHHLATYFGDTFKINVAKQIEFIKRNIWI